MSNRSTLNTSRDYEKASDNALKSAEKKLNLAEEQALALGEIEKGKVNLEKAIRETTDPTEKQNLINALESYQNNVLNPAQIKVSETLASVTQDLENSRQLDVLAEKAATPPEMPILPDLPGALVPLPAMVPNLASQNPGDPTTYSNPLPEYGPNKPAGAPELIPTAQQPVIATVKPRTTVTTPDQTQPQSVTITKTLDEPQAPTSEPVENTGVVQSFAIRPQATLSTTTIPDESSVVRISNPTAEQTLSSASNPIRQAQKTAEQYAQSQAIDTRISSTASIADLYAQSQAINTGIIQENSSLQSEQRDTKSAQSATRRQRTNDLRFRISLASDAEYMYKIANMSDIMYPLKETDGVIFPYTPQISVIYSSNYDQVDVVHSNYKIYNYRNSSVDNISIIGDFTAQDTTEADYVLAVIHFFRSVTKMFYGQDSNPTRGVPPPICYLTGYGEYAFNMHPVLIQNFTLSYPNDVDYINAGAPLVTRQITAYAPPTIIGNTHRQRIESLRRSGLAQGGITAKTTFNTNISAEDSLKITRVPTKLTITLSAIPIITRNDVSNNFSLKEYATGALLTGNTRTGRGIW